MTSARLTALSILAALALWLAQRLLPTPPPAPPTNPVPVKPEPIKPDDKPRKPLRPWRDNEEGPKV